MVHSDIANGASYAQVESFGKACAADMDFRKLPKGLPKHPWDNRTKGKKAKQALPEEGGKAAEAVATEAERTEL